MEKIEISEALYLQLKELYEISTDKELLPHPDEVRFHPFFVMIEMLQHVTDSLSKSDKESNVLFAEYYSVCLRGINPFRDPVLKKAGVDAKTWKRVLKTLNGEC